MAISHGEEENFIESAEELEPAKPSLTSDDAIKIIRTGKLIATTTGVGDGIRLLISGLVNRRFEVIIREHVQPTD
jgi:hypothetical protein